MNENLCICPKFSMRVYSCMRNKYIKPKTYSEKQEEEKNGNLQ